MTSFPLERPGNCWVMLWADSAAGRVFGRPHPRLSDGVIVAIMINDSCHCGHHHHDHHVVIMIIIVTVTPPPPPPPSSSSWLSWSSMSSSSSALSSSSSSSSPSLSLSSYDGSQLELCGFCFVSALLAALLSEEFFGNCKIAAGRTDMETRGSCCGPIQRAGQAGPSSSLPQPPSLSSRSS